MSVVFTVLLTVLVFGFLIFIHELGHFMAARWAGIRVNEFALGMGPQLFKIQGKETVYSLRALPFGGFCAMEGEEEKSDDARAFDRAKPYKRLIVLVAGAFMNILLGFIIIVCTVAPQELIGTRVVSSFTEGALSAQTGLQAGDEIVKIGQVRAISYMDINFLLTRIPDGVTDLTVIRDGERVLLPGVQFYTEEIAEGVYGIRDELRFYGAENTVWRTVLSSAKDTWSVVKLVALSLFDLVRGRVPMSQLSGPVGIGVVIGEASRVSFSYLMNIVMLITINLGFMNLLPLPALDGGRMVFVVLEMIRKKTFKYEAQVHATGFLLLMLLIAVVFLKDIVQLFI